MVIKKSQKVKNLQKVMGFCEFYQSDPQFLKFMYFVIDIKELTIR